MIKNIEWIHEWLWASLDLSVFQSTSSTIMTTFLLNAPVNKVLDLFSTIEASKPDRESGLFLNLLHNHTTAVTTVMSACGWEDRGKTLFGLQFMVTFNIWCCTSLPSGENILKLQRHFGSNNTSLRLLALRDVSQYTGTVIILLI